MAKSFQTLPGFRDFRPEDCAVRNYLFANFREVAKRYGFVEYETPILEPTELYEKKAGGELNSQLFCFEDKGGRNVTLRPEVTAIIPSPFAGSKLASVSATKSPKRAVPASSTSSTSILSASPAPEPMPNSSHFRST